MYKKYIFIFFAVVSTALAYSNKKETSIWEVSFLLRQTDSIDKFKLQLDSTKILYRNSNYTDALEKALLLEKSLSNKKSKNDLTQTLDLYMLIGDIYRRTNSHDNSLNYYKKILALITKLNRKEIIDLTNKGYDEKKSESLLKIGNAFLYKSRLFSAREIDLSKKYVDSSKYYYNQVIELKSSNDFVMSQQASASTNMAQIFSRDSLYKEAKEYALKSSELHRKRNNRISQAVALGSLASIYLEQNEFKEAESTYRKALEIVESYKSERSIKVKEQLLYNLAYNLYKLRDPEAYIIQEDSYQIKDSLRDIEVRAMIEKMGKEFNFESKKELLLRDEENKRLKEQRTFTIVGIFAILIIISLLYWVKLNQLKLQKTEIQKNQELAKIKSQLQTKILNATIDGRETERKDIAETLHDSVSALLSSANLHLQASRRKIEGETPDEIDKTQKIIHEATDKIRDLSHTLVSSVLLKFGLKYAVSEMAEKYSNSDLEIQVNIKNVRRYQQRFEIKIFNIIQEFVNNILKHSKASKASIELRETNKKLVISVIDNGIGFDKTKIPNKDGLGINQIEARIQVMNGQFQIESSKKSGTHIYMSVPIVEKEAVNLDYQAQ